MDAFCASYQRLSVEDATRQVHALLPQALSTLPLSEAAVPFVTKACYHAARTLDGAQFEQLFALLLPHLLASPTLLKDRTVLTLMGLQLLNLLVSGRKRQFHVLVAQLPLAVLDEPLVAFPISVERSLLEGTYGRILAMPAEQLPTPEYALFLQGLEERIRLDLAANVAAAFHSLPLTRCLDLLMLDSKQRDSEDCHMLLQSLAQHHKWHIRDDIVFFRHPYTLEDPTDPENHPVALLRTAMEHIHALQGPSISS